MKGSSICSKKFAYVVVVLVLLSLNSIVIASGASSDNWAWIRTWGGAKVDHGSEVAVSNFGDLYQVDSAGSYSEGHYDIVLIKYDSSGDLLWNRTWGGNSRDDGTEVVVSTTGDVYQVGSTWSYSAGDSDVVLLKYDSSGTLLWYRTWGGTDWDYALGVEVSTMGDIYVTGCTKSYGSGDSDIVLLRYDSLGNLIWNKTWGGPDKERGEGVAVSNLGNIYVTGDTQSYGLRDDVVLLKYDSSGNLNWCKTWGGNYSELGLGVAVSSTGDVYITGDTHSYSTGECETLLLRYDASGNLIWNRTWGGVKADYGSEVSVSIQGDIYITGNTWSYGAGNFDILLLKYDSSGNLLWNKTWGDAERDDGREVAVSTLGDIYIAGDHGGQVVLLRYDASGNLIWYKCAPASGSGGIALSSTGDIYVSSDIYAAGDTSSNQGHNYFSPFPKWIIGIAVATVVGVAIATYFVKVKKKHSDQEVTTQAPPVRSSGICNYLNLNR